VLLIANTLPHTDLSGVGEQVVQLAGGLREAGHEVEVLGRGPGGAPGPKVLFPLTVALPFLRLRRRFRPHVVQVHESDGVCAALLTLVLRALWRPQPLLVALLQVSYVEEIRAVRALRAGGRVLGRPGAVEMRFRWTKGPLQVVLGWLTTFCADLVMTPSDRTGLELRRDYGVERTLTLPNVKKPLATAAPALQEDGGFFLFVGRLRIRKGVEVLFAALAALRDGVGPRLRVAGDGEHREALQRAAARFGVTDRVEFLGRRDSEQVRSLLGRCRALVVPSTYEGMPLVILEAMEEGAPVIASRVSGIPEVVSDRVTGWLVPPEDPGALAAALAHAGSDPDEARRRGRAGRERLDRDFRPKAAIETWQRHVGSAMRNLVSQSGDGSEGSSA
jgi:glycosyltransferase involved in cell wall biosynthesis